MSCKPEGRWYVVAAGDIIRSDPHGKFVASTGMDHSGPPHPSKKRARTIAKMIVDAVNDRVAADEIWNKGRASKSRRRT